MTHEEAFVRLIAREEAERVVTIQFNEAARTRDYQSKIDALRDEISSLREDNSRLQKLSSSEVRDV